MTLDGQKIVVIGGSSGMGRQSFEPRHWTVPRSPSPRADRTGSTRRCASCRTAALARPWTSATRPRSPPCSRASASWITLYLLPATHSPRGHSRTSSSAMLAWRWTSAFGAQ